jgi:sucrose-6-phosphate hydrolase SacC (GH32 family)
MAIPNNDSDPDLVSWVKPSYNPVISHRPDYNFRDPTTAWKPQAEDGDDVEWRMEVGCSGHMCIFRSHDFVKWRDAGVFYHVPHQYMWECPDFFQISPDRWVVKASSAPFDEYVVGTYTPGTNDSFVRVAGAEDLGQAIPNGQLIDSGDVCASKTFFDPIGKREADSLGLGTRGAWLPIAVASSELARHHDLPSACAARPSQ